VGEIWEVVVVCEGRKRRERVGRVFEVRVPCPGENFGGGWCAREGTATSFTAGGPDSQGWHWRTRLSVACGGISCAGEGFPDFRSCR
jgi:hypothetical protein